MFEPFEEAPPSSQTPVIFETRVEETAKPPRRRRPSLAHRLAPVALLPLLFAILGGFYLRASMSARALAAAPPPAEADPIKPRQHAAQEDDDLEVLSVCPKGMALVVRDDLRVCVDRWEASIVEVSKSGSEKPHSPYMTPNTWTGAKYKAVSLPGVVPQAYVSKVQAQIACKNAGKRLCRGDEWRAACEGPAKTTYPYGEKENRRACNTRGKNPLPMLLGSSKTFMWGTAMHHPLLNTFPGTVAKTGAFEQCQNDYGVFDMVGNLHEWTADGDFRGGYYRDDHVNAPGCRYRTSAHAPTYSDYSTGFRCCADPH